MLEVVCFRWRPPPGYRSSFSPETVNVLQRMVRRHYPHPHRFTCVTDDPAGINGDVRIIPLWPDYADVASPHGGKNPSCYRRLKLFSREAATLIGPRILALDLDTVITADVTALWDRPEDFVIWGDTNPKTYYNGSMILLTAGARAKVWDDFRPKTSPKLAKTAGHFGSDQGWISYCLGPGEAKWTRADGVYSYRNDLSKASALPRNAKMVMFHGRHDPWSPHSRQESPWLAEYYL